MARIIKEEEYTARRNEILDVAQKLVQTKGYEQMTIQDVLEELQISKGAFYHYFDSKGALLEAMIDRTQAEMDQMLQPIVQDPHLPALQKLRLFFDLSSSWKSARRDYMLAILRTWYHDDNAVFRQRVYTNGLKWISPSLTEIARQGVREGTLSVPYPEHVGEILFSLFTGLGDSVAHLCLTPEPSQTDFQHLVELITTYSDALERVLGAPKGSLLLADPESLKIWFTTPVENHHHTGEALNEGILVS